MMYLGIDQHARHLTISLRDESGDVVQARQETLKFKRESVEIKPYVGRLVPSFERRVG